MILVYSDLTGSFVEMSFVQRKVLCSSNSAKLVAVAESEYFIHKFQLNILLHQITFSLLCITNSAQ